MIDAPANIYTLALYVARRTFKAWALKQGYKARDITAALADRAARAWLDAHPEALQMAAERIAQSPRLRALAKSEARQREREQRCSDIIIPVQISGAE
jgi:hypothetical protein